MVTADAILVRVMSSPVKPKPIRLLTKLGTFICIAQFTGFIETWRWLLTTL